LTYQYTAKLDQHFDWIIVDKLLPSIFQKFLKAVDLQALCQKLYIIDNSLVNEIILSIRTQMQLLLALQCTNTNCMPPDCCQIFSEFLQRDPGSIVQLGSLHDTVLLRLRVERCRARRP